MTEINGYHAHVYYNADTRKIAEGLRDRIIEKFTIPGLVAARASPYR